MHVRIYDYSCKFDMVNKSQFGFRKSCNNSDAVLEFFCDADNSLENNSYLIAVFAYFSKAFYCVCHDVLIRKLERIGIRGGVLKLFSSYLANRKQCVQLKNHKPDYLTISTGVPKGSMLGLLLLNINDMMNACGGLKCIQFADDTTLYATGTDISSLVSGVGYVSAPPIRR